MMFSVIFIRITFNEKYNMTPKLIKAIITDDDRVMMDGKYSPIGVMESRILLQDPKYDVTISKHGLFRIGWQDRQGTPIGPQAPRPVKAKQQHKKVAPVKAASPVKKLVPEISPTPPLAPQKPHVTPVTPHPITPSTVKVDKSQPSFEPIPFTHY